MEIKHKKGDQMYIPTQLYISRGSDDIQGGKATITKLDINDKLGKDHTNGVFVQFEGFPGRSWNYKLLLDKQEEYAKEYKDQVAKPDPDVDTPWIEPGDIVDGKVYTGKPIW